MAITLTAEVTITVNTEEEAIQIMDACNSGLAELAIKDRVLYGGKSYVGVAPSPVTDKISKEETKLKKVETKVHGTANPQEKVETTIERSHGILGRKRPERSGGR